MRAFGLACFCVCLAVAGGGSSTSAQAQSDAGAVLLPPASIPFSRSRPATPRANFSAPNPLPRPVIEDQALLEADQGALVLPPAPAPIPPAPSPPIVDPAIIEPATVAPEGPSRALPANVSPNTGNRLPPNPTPRSDFANSAPSISEEGDDASDREEEGAIPSPPTDRAPEPIIDLACHQTLSALGAMFEPRGRVEGSGQCGIDDAVALHAIGAITLQPAALISCPTAATFTAFVQQTITPQAVQTMGSEPSTIYVAASYACRGRNNVPGARMSEHAFGRAVDIRALELEDGQSWNVRPRAADADEPAARLQAALRAEGCGPFNTVLGPGSDGHHTDHIHFDNARRSSTYCR